ncbi:DUF1592 domain-containing protein [Shewanella sp. 10N.7]|uniref:DUF1592 domain-containing protein n=1 Tax=Shewanella sp. 10N.7 TaxID=2885093 RepID=UPI001E48DEDC|nr:DUF1592 domain-containing protein [Shewanella sp. 10N.7]MCC4831796.1 DUF1592 domain-containing protein [Shewanella sp. 10N.7]
MMNNKSIAFKFYLVSVASVFLSFIMLMIATAFSPLDGISGDGVMRFFGRFHPLVLHFPITLLFLALGIELLNRVLKFKSRLSVLSLPVLMLAVITACLTATLGVLLASNEGHMGGLVESHRFLGISVAVFATIALILRWGAEKVQTYNKSLSLASLGALFVSCITMIFAAHYGGNMVHGKNYLPEFAPQPLKAFLSTSITEEPNQSPIKVRSAKEQKLLSSYQTEISPIIERNCVSCHGDSKQKAGIRFDQLDPAMHKDSEVNKWSSVRDALNSHQMPPKEEGRQPTEYERQQFVDWIDASFEYVSLQRKANRASSMRRLTVVEYENTLQELFGTQFKFAQDLPAAPLSKHGYSRDAELISVSALELEYFLKIARQGIENYVLFDDEPIPESEHFLIEFEDVVFQPGVDGGFSVAQPHNKQQFEDKLKAKQSEISTYAPRSLFPLPEGALLENDEEGLLKLGYKQKLNGLYARLTSRQNHKNGELVARIRVSSKKGLDGSVPRLEFQAGDTVGTEIGSISGGECDVTAHFSEPQICSFRIPLEEMPVNFNKKSNRVTLFLFNQARDPAAVYALAPEGLNTHPKRPRLLRRHLVASAAANEAKASMREFGVNELYLESAEIEIIPFGTDPNANVWRVDSHQAQESDSAAKEVAADTLKAFMKKAYRRRIATNELDSMLSLYTKFRRDGDSFKDALKETLSTVLVSTPFLFVASPISPENEIELSKDERHQLAARLSYFLWSSPPDERLIDLAANNQLSDPAVMAEEVNRMLADQRARQFSSQFAREWLRLDKFDLVAVNPEFYPLYDEALGRDMIAETLATFQQVFHGNKDARTLINSDIVYINQRLARHYGLPPVTGGKMKATKVESHLARGGLLQQAAILTMNADGAESNPIYRGVWLLERLLNDPPPPPPPSVPPLDTSAEDFAKLTLKQKIELHRSQSACAACHANLDPWGLPLESFDAIGAWRKQALVINPNTSERTFSPIDSSTVLVTGEKIEGSIELLSYLVSERVDEISRSLNWHMMAYALGREPNLGDTEALEMINSQFKASGYKLSSLVLAIVQSEPFQATPENQKTSSAPFNQAISQVSVTTKSQSNRE